MDKLRVVLVIGFVLMLATTNAVYADVDYLKIELPYLAGSIVISANLPNHQNEQLVVGRGEAAYIYNDDELVASITDFSGNVTALATGDLTGDFRSEILIGTDQMNFYVYQFQNGHWIQINEIRHLWAPVAYLEVTDITGNGWGDVIVLNQRGEAFIYLSWQGNLEVFWRTKPNEQLKFIKTADITGNDCKDVVYTYNSGYVGVLSWFDGQFNLVSENYPWGSIENLMISDSQGGSAPEIIVTTGQNFLYSWQWNNNYLDLRSYFSHQMRGTKSIYDQGMIINVDPITGLNGYNLQGNNLSKRWSIRVEDISEVFRFNENFIVRDSKQRYYLLEPFDYDQLNIFLDEELLLKPPKLVINNGSLYISLLDFSALAEWITLEDNVFLIGDNKVAIERETGIILENTISMPIVNPVIEEYGSSYISMAALSILGYEVEFQPNNSELHMRKQWGWW